MGGEGGGDTGRVPVTSLFTRRHEAGGASAPPYDAANLSGDVGDDPAAVASNRAALARRVGVPAGSLAFMRQVHGCDVAVLDGPPTGAPPAVDGLVTATPGLALAVLTADCVPVLLADEAVGVVAVAHAGRRGVQLGIARVVVDAMRDLGATAITATLGPSIGVCCYQVGADLAVEVVAAVPETRGATRGGSPALDLRAGLAAQLRAAGVQRIDVDDACTAEDPGLFSYRRDGVTGRGAGVVALTERPG